jgi:hypothetical protein
MRKSTDAGVTWSGDLRLIANGINPAVAVNSAGHVGFAYQTLVGGNSWETHLEISNNGFATAPTSNILAKVPSATPVATFLPYLGDYIYLMAVGATFYGVFSANNTPDNANFPQGVTYQRNANFTTHKLLNVDNVTPVNVSIDPFFFTATDALTPINPITILPPVHPIAIQPPIHPIIVPVLTPIHPITIQPPEPIEPLDPVDPAKAPKKNKPE